MNAHDDVNGFAGGSTPRATATATKTVEEPIDMEGNISYKKNTPKAKAPVVEDDDEDLAMFRELADLDD